VVEGHRYADPVLLRIAKDLADEVGVVEDIVVRQRRTLGEAGRPGGVLNVDRVVEAEHGLAGVELRLADLSGVSEQSFPGVLEHDRLSKLRAADADLVEHGNVVRLPEYPSKQEQADAGLIQHVLELSRLVGRIDVDENSADA